MRGGREYVLSLGLKDLNNTDQATWMEYKVSVAQPILLALS